MLKAITVFCGSSIRCPEEYRAAADHVGRVIAQTGRSLVYGGGSRGLMGDVAKAVLEEGGHVTGVEVELFKNSPYQLEVSERIMTPDMSERKRKLIDLSDACIALPGGIGTLDEITELISLNQLKVFNKPIGILNMQGFYNGFLQQMETVVELGFIRENDYRRVQIADTIEELLEKLEAYAAQQEEVRQG